MNSFMHKHWKTGLSIGIGILLVALCVRYWNNISGFLAALLSAASPLLIGCVIAYPLNIIMSFYERHWFTKSKRSWVIKTRRLFCLVLAVLSMLGIVALILLLVVPQLWDAIMLLIEEIPEALRNLFAWLKNWGIVPENLLSLAEGIDWKTQLSKILSTVTSSLGSAVGVAVNLVSTLFSGVFNALLAIIFAFYLLFCKDTLSRQGKKLMARYLRGKTCEKILHVLHTVDDCFHRYLVGQCTEALILGVLCMIGMLIFRFPYATMVGALVAFTALIPVAGAYIGAAVGAFMIMTVDPMKAVFFLIFLIVLQQLEGNLIFPRVVGSSIGLPGIWVLAAVTVGGGVLGIPGMIIGVPLAAAAYKLLREAVNKPAGTQPVENTEGPNPQ